MAFIIFHERYNNHLAMTVSAAKAAKIMDMLDNPPDDITEEQGAFLVAIKKIYPGNPAQREPDNSHIIHPGIQQGRMMGVPTGDRD